MACQSLTSVKSKALKANFCISFFYVFVFIATVLVTVLQVSCKVKLFFRVVVIFVLYTTGREDAVLMLFLLNVN